MAESFELSDAVINFFTFNAINEQNPSQNFGYSENIVGYDFLDKRVIIDNQGMLSFMEQSNMPLAGRAEDGLTRIRFNDYDDVRQALTRTVRELYGVDEKTPVRVGPFFRHEACTTNPYVVRATVGNESKIFYVKKPDVRRALGKAFYNLLVDDRFISYKFNEAGFVVDQVPGAEVHEDDRDDLLEKKNFVGEIVRLNVFSNLIFLSDILYDWSNPNCSYSQEQGIYLFDFDQAFREGEYSVPTKDPRMRTKVDFKAIEEKERYNIHKNLRRHSTRINDLIEAVNAEIVAPDIAWKAGGNDMGEALRNRFSQIGKW